jgi:hypothetical protein
MKSITPQILQYREAARVLWNSFLREKDALGGGAISSDGALHDWHALKHLLFTAIVLRGSKMEGSDACFLGSDRCALLWKDPTSFIRVVPHVDAPVMITRVPGDHGYWDHPVRRLGPEDADLRFIDFFDFGQAGYLDFKYYVVSIESSVRHPVLAGHRALIEVQYADVFVDETVSLNPAP